MIRRSSAGGPRSPEGPGGSRGPESREITDAELLFGGYYLSEHKEQEPQIEDFKGIIPDEEIAKDAERIRQKEAGFKRENEAGLPTGHDQAKYLEAFLASTDVSEANWFGTDESPMLVQQTMKFDDYFSGVDSIWEWKREDGTPIRLALDTTTASNVDTLYVKMDRMHQSVQDGRLGEVKYYRSPFAEGREEGPTEQIPHVIIGIDREGFQRLAREYAPIIEARKELERMDAKHKKARPTPQDEARKKELERLIDDKAAAMERDPVPLMILDQIRAQLGNQLADAAASFFKARGNEALRDPEGAEAMKTAYRSLKALMDKAKLKEKTVLEREEFIEAVGQALPAIRRLSEYGGGAIGALHDTLTFIEKLTQEKKESRRKNAPALGDATRPLNETLSAPWSPYVRRDLPDLRV